MQVITPKLSVHPFALFTRVPKSLTANAFVRSGA